MIAPAQLPDPPTRVGNKRSISGRTLNTQAHGGKAVQPETTATNIDAPKSRNPKYHTIMVTDVFLNSSTMICRASSVLPSFT